MNKKTLCTLMEDGDMYHLLLSDDQIAMVGWIIDKLGYPLRLEMQPEKPLEITFEDWADKAIG